MHHMYEELVRADLAEQRAEAARLRMIPQRSRQPVLPRIRGKFAITLRCLADHLEPA
ncbi:hypothetical protein SAMN05421874_12011 [Nonomuraea maritima]|uniref:Uncharacterized protein n=2 Tax=Nonomuraea maritima TaxID=683260 RepID=A0A1G9JD96_9ACTN|nr:hypothetical protein SAMN05421874_12011 [Nonomuraea maritima]